VSDNLHIIVTSYFEHSNEATKVLVHTPVWGIGLDFLHGAKNFESLESIANSEKKLIAGVVDGRNIWKNDITKTAELLENIAKSVKKQNIIVSSSCSLLHTPFTLKYEEKMDDEIKNWLSYAVEKLDEVSLRKHSMRVTKKHLKQTKKLTHSEKTPHVSTIKKYNIELLTSPS